jgi:cytochrome c
MSSFELNKVFAAILVAGIIAMLSGFVAHKVVHPHKLDEDAVPVEGGPVESGGAAKVELPEPIMHLIATADITKGEKLSKACAACHSFDKGGPHRVGPNLWNTMGLSKGGHAGFAYSDALANFGGSWGYLEMNKFLWKPKKYVPGTKMNFLGLKKPQDRADIIAWLRTLADNPLPMPSATEIAAEKTELSPPEPEASETEVEEDPAVEDQEEPAAGQ